MNMDYIAGLSNKEIWYIIVSLCVIVSVIIVISGIVKHTNGEKFTHKKYAMIKDLSTKPNVVIPPTFNDKKPLPAHGYTHNSLMTRAMQAVKISVIGSKKTPPRPVTSHKNRKVVTPQAAAVVPAPAATVSGPAPVSVTPQPLEQPTTAVVASEPVTGKAAAQPVAATAEPVTVEAGTVNTAAQPVAVEAVAVKAAAQPVIVAAETVTVKAAAQPVIVAAPEQPPVAPPVPVYAAPSKAWCESRESDHKAGTLSSGRQAKWERDDCDGLVAPAPDACYARVAQGCVNKPNRSGGIWQDGLWHLVPGNNAQKSSSKCKQKVRKLREKCNTSADYYWGASEPYPIQTYNP